MPGKSFLHRLNPITKIVWSLAVITVAFAFREPLPLLALWASVLAVALAGRVFKEILPALRGLLVFAAIFFLFQVFLINEGRTLFTLIPGTGFGRITDVGLTACTVLALRMLAMTSTIPVILTTTPSRDMIVAFIDKLKVPYVYALMLVTSLRFIPTLQEELNLVIQAQRARAYDLEGRHLGRYLMAIVPLAVPLLLSSVQRARIMAIAMETRGFNAGPRTSFRTSTFQPLDYGAIAACLVLGAILLAVSL
ncbi:MAG: energy-coupling factor transport system permease protein [Moorella sp. (in: firmicutes)]|uniref:Energy-coupling factor transporter transmembrane protein EcfT n=1 Tax=Neomoorella thermoacetica TaxID=1525 RepID=A0A1J5NHY3_NEOTH|nr:energy-coupling factor transport system permease protein [Moorella sp. (in: firmicutes)]OIQ58458.1 energy-coupling factor transporter transmembrane protein EcfT [Moorella thermoacetica]